MNKIITLIITFHVSLLTLHFAEAQEYMIRIPDMDTEKELLLAEGNIQLQYHDFLPEGLAVVDEVKMAWLGNAGIAFEMIREYTAGGVDPEYHTFEELWFWLDSVAGVYPEITQLDTLGYSHELEYPIPVFKVSDNPDVEEDEPAISYDGLHHAREPPGLETCLKIIEHLLSNYDSDPQVQFWVDNIEFFFIPMLNPDGYKYIVDNSLTYPFWRKNFHDNNANGQFDPSYDGVDLNRNYDSYWSGGDPNPASWTYRGEAPFSERETQLKRDLFLEQKPVMSISYHTYGEIVVTPRVLGYSYAPDRYLLGSIASEISSRIPRLNAGNYGSGNCACDVGQSPCWAYKVAGTMETLIELGTVFIPPGPEAMQIAEDNLEGALYLPERVFGPGVCGHITCMETGNPLEATFKVLEIYDTIITPRTSKGMYGRYHRLLLPGTYTFEFSKEGYDTLVVEDVEVGEDTLTVLDVQLMPPNNVAENSYGDQITQNSILNIQNYPNPNSGVTSFRFQVSGSEHVTLKIYDMHGQEVATVVDREMAAGEHVVSYDALHLPSGVYFIIIRSGNEVVTRKMIKL
jgi:hypothetical protein